MRITKAIRRYFIAGFLVWVPIGVTIFVLKFLIEIIGSSVSLLPSQYQPSSLVGFNIPGIDFLFVLLVIFLTGVLATNYFGRYFIRWWDKLIHRIPLIRTIYSGVKQVLETVFQPTGKAFRKVLLVEYPRRGLWSIAFQTGPVTTEIQNKTSKTMITIFIPTTPNPTSGFLMMVSQEEVHELEMTVDQALKFIVSLGVVQPGQNGMVVKNAIPK